MSDVEVQPAAVADPAAAAPAAAAPAAAADSSAPSAAATSSVSAPSPLARVSSNNAGSTPASPANAVSGSTPAKEERKVGKLNLGAFGAAANNADSTPEKGPVGSGAGGKPTPGKLAMKMNIPMFAPGAKAPTAGRASLGGAGGDEASADGTTSDAPARAPGKLQANSLMNSLNAMLVSGPPAPRKPASEGGDEVAAGGSDAAAAEDGPAPAITHAKRAKVSRKARTKPAELAKAGLTTSFEKVEESKTAPVAKITLVSVAPTPAALDSSSESAAASSGGAAGVDAPASLSRTPSVKPAPPAGPIPASALRTESPARTPAGARPPPGPVPASALAAAAVAKDESAAVAAKEEPKQAAEPVAAEPVAVKPAATEPVPVAAAAAAPTPVAAAPVTAAPVTAEPAAAASSSSSSSSAAPAAAAAAVPPPIPASAAAPAAAAASSSSSAAASNGAASAKAEEPAEEITVAALLAAASAPIVSAPAASSAASSSVSASSSSAAPAAAAQPTPAEVAASKAFASLYGDYEAPAFDEAKADDYRMLTAAGAEFLKHGASGKPHKRLVFATSALLLLWVEPGKRKAKPDPKQSIDLSRASVPKIAVVKGRTTPNFTRSGVKADPNKCLSVINARERVLDLEASSQEERDHWHEAISFLLHEAQLAREKALVYGAMG